MGGGVKPNSDVVLKFSGFLIMKPPLSVCEFVYLSVTFAFIKMLTHQKTLEKQRKFANDGIMRTIR